MYLKHNQIASNALLCNFDQRFNPNDERNSNEQSNNVILQPSDYYSHSICRGLHIHCK